MRALTVCAFFFLVGCDTAVAVDPEGHRCDAVNACPVGYACVEGSCRRGTTLDPCAGVNCTADAPTCVSNAVARTFTARCVAGQCQQEPVDMTCPTSCAAGACVDACVGVTCTSAPSPTCHDANTLRTFAMVGTCAAGRCDYASTDTACPNGCDNGVCKGVDLCASMGVTCTTPPDAICMGATRRTFTAPGTCEPGTGQCSYPQADTPCPNGCALGACLMASLNFTQTGPRVRFAVNAIDVAPGSSGDSALAVGNGGRLARWDGTTWRELTTPSNGNLHAVSFVTGTLAWVVGAGGTAYTVRASNGQISPQTLLASSSTTFRHVSGRGEGEVLVADGAGAWWRARGGTWTSGTLPMANAPWLINGVQLDESLRERLVGSCANGASRQRCVAFRNLNGTSSNFSLDSQAGTAFTAVGGGFGVPNAATSEAALGIGDNSLFTHTSFGTFTNLTPSPALTGQGVVGISAQAVANNRDVYVLTSSKDPSPGVNGRGHLYRLARATFGGVTSVDALTTYFGEEVLSPNDANGVLVAEVRRLDNVNNIFRRGPVTNEALDIGEDLIGASVDDTGGLVAASGFGDVVVRAAASSTFEFRRPPADWSIRALEARNGTGTLLVGRAVVNTDGLIIRNVGAAFTTVATRANTTFNAVCRVSDTEGWAVGTGGVIFRVTAVGAMEVTSPTTQDLLAVDCAAGVAVAVGAGGTVLRMTAGAWAAVTPALTGAPRLETVALVQAGAYVAGPSTFARFTVGSGWTPLLPETGLTRLVARGPQEVYGAFVSGNTTALRRFDGAAWGPGLVTVTGVLGGGVQAGARVVWGGSLGALVEGH